MSEFEFTFKESVEEKKGEEFEESTNEFPGIVDELVDKSEDIQNGKMLYEVIDFHLPSPGAIAIEFSRLPSMLGLLKKFDRAAVLADKTWLRKISELERVLYPSLEIRAFDMNQKEEAEAWLSS